MNGYVFESDQRFKQIKQSLKEKGYFIYDTLEKVEDLSFLVLGLKGIDQHFFMITKENQLKLDHVFFKRLKKGTRIYTGVYNGLLDQICQKYQLNYYVILHDEALMDMNASLTSEGVIANLITHLHDPLFSLKVLITGFGKCGKDLAYRLKALDMDVVIAVRNPKQKIQASHLGYAVMDLDEMGKFDGQIIVNTVPAMIFNDELLQQLADCYFFDIASFPFGLDHSKASRLQIHTLLLPGLPGKYAYHYAGKEFAKYIDRKEKEYD